MDIEIIHNRSLQVRLMAFFLGALLAMMPLMANSRTLILLMADQGAMPAPITEEEEVKHACSINWHPLCHATDDHLLEGLSAPRIEDPYNEVEHFEVDVPPPKF